MTEALFAGPGAIAAAGAGLAWWEFRNEKPPTNSGAGPGLSRSDEA